jgi:hypothetical protein
MKRNYSQNLSVSPGNVFDVLELMVESHVDLTGLCSVAIFVDAVVRRPENPHILPSGDGSLSCAAAGQG